MYSRYQGPEPGGDRITALSPQENSAPTATWNHDLNSSESRIISRRMAVGIGADAIQVTRHAAGWRKTVATYEGGCLCGNIRFRATGPADWPHTCSCKMCQRHSGALTVAWVEFPRDRVEWTGPGGAPRDLAVVRTVEPRLLPRLRQHVGGDRRCAGDRACPGQLRRQQPQGADARGPFLRHGGRNGGTS